jgi:archaellin
LKIEAIVAVIIMNIAAATYQKSQTVIQKGTERFFHVKAKIAIAITR